MASDADDPLLRHVERFAQVLEESGMPRMAARVFTYLLSADRERHTAGALAEGLRVSPAAISGAVRYLVRGGLVIKEREPGQRGDVYRLDGTDVWSRIYRERTHLLRHYEKAAAEGADTLGPDTPGGRRMHESRLFFTFMRTELESVMARWQDERTRLGPDD